MLRKFRIRLNEKEYIVEMEELTSGGETLGVQSEAQESIIPEKVAKQDKPVVQQTERSNFASGEGEKVTAPMPGTILDILVGVGDDVQEAQPVVVLEAMKMENQIVAPISGKITSIAVAKGETVDVGALLFTVDG